MKCFWLLFSFFLFTLSVYPCSDNDECGTNSKTEVSKNTNKDKHSQETERCSPFCNCSHCPVSAFYQLVPFYNIKKGTILIENKKRISFYSFTYNKKIADKIWQPPKIS